MKQTQKNGIPADFRKVAEDLWRLLDDISIMGEAIKPEDYDSFVRYFEQVNRIARKRHHYFRGGGLDILTVEEWNDMQQKTNEILLSALSKR